jgi:hypothetical protein
MNIDASGLLILAYLLHIFFNVNLNFCLDFIMLISFFSLFIEENNLLTAFL